MSSEKEQRKGGACHKRMECEVKRGKERAGRDLVARSLDKVLRVGALELLGGRVHLFEQV